MLKKMVGYSIMVINDVQYMKHGLQCLMFNDELLVMGNPARSLDA